MSPCRKTSLPLGLLETRFQSNGLWLSLSIYDTSELHCLALLVSFLHVSMQKDVPLLGKICALYKAIIVPVRKAFDSSDKLAKLPTALIDLVFSSIAAIFAPTFAPTTSIAPSAATTPATKQLQDGSKSSEVSTRSTAFSLSFALLLSQPNVVWQPNHVCMISSLCTSEESKALQA